MSYPPPIAPEYAPQPYQHFLPPATPPKRGIVTAGLILGIVGVVLSWVPGLGFLLGVAAIIFSAIALSKAAGKGKSITGLVLGIVTVLVNAIVTASLAGSSTTSAAPTSTPTSTQTSAAPAAARVKATTAPAAPVATTPVAVVTAKPAAVVTTQAPVAAAPPPAVKTKAPAESAIATSFGDGSYEVGVDVAPGKYKSSGATEGLFEFCSVTTTNSNGDTVDWETAGKANEQVLITLKSGQTVESSGCQEFRKR